MKLKLYKGRPENTGGRLEKYMNLTSGSVSIMGLINDTKNHVRLLVD